MWASGMEKRNVRGQRPILKCVCVKVKEVRLHCVWKFFWQTKIVKWFISGRDIRHQKWISQQLDHVLYAMVLFRYLFPSLSLSFSSLRTFRSSPTVMFVKTVEGILLPRSSFMRKYSSKSFQKRNYDSFLTLRQKTYSSILINVFGLIWKNENEAKISWTLLMFGIWRCVNIKIMKSA